MIFLRWYISRIYTDDRFTDAPNRSVDVAVQPCSPQLLEELGAGGLDTLAAKEYERLDWWIEDEQQTLEGTIGEEILVHAVCEHHASVAVADTRITPSERQLVEDLVLVQKLDDRRRFDEELDRQRNMTDQPKLEQLALTAGSTWIDLTQHARHATSMLYLEALGEGESEGSPGGGT